MTFPDLGPRPYLGYTASAVDRAAALRTDEAALVKLAARPESAAYVVAGELIVTRKSAGGNDPLFTLPQAHSLGEARSLVFLGLLDGVGRFGLGLDQAAAEALKSDDDYFITDLRSIAMQGLVAQDHLPPLAEAKALLSWHARHRFCSNCGAPTAMTQGGWRRDCAACGAFHFPRTDPVVIMLAVDGEHCLLGRQPRFVASMWSCLAGFVEPGETIEEAVRRETLEEAGVVCGEVAYRASQPWPFPMSLMIGCHARALTRELRIDHTELEAANWYSREEAALMLVRSHPDGYATPPPIAIAHHIIRAWVEEGDGVFR